MCRRRLFVSAPLTPSIPAQRFYHALTSPNPPVPPYNTSTKFAGLPVGPANSKGEDAGAGVTMFRVSLKDRTIVDEVQFKGWTIRLADWLHLSNPDDPSRPIIGQVFKCYISEERSVVAIVKVFAVLIDPSAVHGRASLA